MELFNLVAEVQHHDDTDVGTQSPSLGSTMPTSLTSIVCEGGDGLDQHQMISRIGYKLCYPQLFTHLKRRSEEAQAATLEFGKENSKRWLKVLNDYWLGNKKYLCGDQITIADYLAVGLVTAR